MRACIYTYNICVLNIINQQRINDNLKQIFLFLNTYIIIYIYYTYFLCATRENTRIFTNAFLKTSDHVCVERLHDLRFLKITHEDDTCIFCSLSALLIQRLNNKIAANDSDRINDW